MSISVYVLSGRRESALIQTDRCRIEPILPSTTDATSGKVIEQYGPAIYEGRCRVTTYEPQEQNPVVGGSRLTVQRYSVQVPVTVPVPVNALVTILACKLDPAMVGKKYRTVAELHKTQATSQRVGIEEMPL